MRVSKASVELMRGIVAEYDGLPRPGESDNSSPPGVAQVPAAESLGTMDTHRAGASALKIFLSSTLPILAGIVVVAWVAYTRLDDSISDTRKELAAQIAASESRSGETQRATDSKIQSFRDRSEDISRQMLKEIADLRVRQVQVESKQ